MKDLIARFLEDRRSLAEEELAALTRHLAEHPEELAEVRAQLAWDDLLSRCFEPGRAGFLTRVAAAVPQARPEAVSDAKFVRAVRRRVRKEMAPSFLEGVGLWWAAHRRMALAGCGVVAGVLAALFFLRPTPPEARLAEIQGEVRVTRGTQTLAAVPGLVLRAGDWVRTGAEGAAAVEFPGETTRLALGAGAELRVVSAHPAKHLDLDAGTLTASVAHQPAGQPMRLRTPTARAEVLGTEFELSASTTSTQLRVTEGRVHIAQKDAVSGVVVETAQTATVTDAPTVQIASLLPPPPLPLPVPAAGAGLDAELLAHWTFDGAAAGRDASGHGRDLTFGPGAVFSAGHTGQALDLRTAKVQAEAPSIPLPPVFTVAFWAYLQPGGPARVQPLFGCAAPPAGGEEFWLSLPPTFPGSGLVFEVRGRSKDARALAKRGVVFAGRWHHLAVVVDSPRGRASFFVDGRDVTEQPGLRRDGKFTGPLLIGGRRPGGPPPFDGLLDDLRIYDHALTPAELAGLALPDSNPK